MEGVSGVRDEGWWDRRGGLDSTDLDVSAQVQKTHRWPCHPPLPPPPLAFVTSPLSDDQVHAIAADVGAASAMDKSRRKAVGMCMQIKMNVIHLTDTARPSAADVEAL